MQQKKDILEKNFEKENEQKKVITRRKKKRNAQYRVEVCV